MGRQSRQIAAIVILLFGAVWSLVAQNLVIPAEQVKGYTIAEYEFSIKGKTSQNALREAIIPAGGDRLYASEEQLLEALEAKRQNLINRQIFMDVSYEHQIHSFVNGVVYWEVTFYVEDSKTFLALPYPKFDNDTTGLLLGVKAKDTNFFGTLGALNLTAYISQNDGSLESWEDREDHVALDIRDVRFWNTSLDLDFSYTRRKTTNPIGAYKFGIDWSEVPIFSQRLSFSIDGIIDRSTGERSLNYSIGLGRIRLLGADLLVKTWGELQPTLGQDYGLHPELFGLSLTYGPFRQNEARYTLLTSLEINEQLTNLHSQIVLTQHDLRLFTRPLSFNIAVKANQEIYKESIDDLLVSMTLGTNVNLPFSIKWETSASAAVLYTEGNDPFNKYYFDFVNTISGGRGVNYLSSLHKFRKGLSYSAKHFYRVFPQDEYIDDAYWYLEGNVTWFPLAGWRMNPAIRLNSFYVNNNDKTKFEFLPSNKNLDISDYLRGSLSTSPQIKAANGVVDYGVVTNLSMLIDFIDFGFAKSYVNPFIDIGYFGSPRFDDGLLFLASIGVEGWGVLKRFPSHPMRASLGFNLIDIIDAFKGEIEAGDIEWKVSISFELHF